MACCRECEWDLKPVVHAPTLAIRRALFDVPVVAGLVYRGVVRRVITSYKDRGVAALAHRLALPLQVATDHVATVVDLEGAAVVCVPHSPGGWVRRGRHPTHELSRRIRAGDGVLPVRTLRFATTLPAFAEKGAQKAKSRRDRLESPRQMIAEPRVAGRRVVLVDDVLTTGITLEIAARAIGNAGGLVVGGVVLAATPPRRGNILG